MVSSRSGLGRFGLLLVVLLGLSEFVEARDELRGLLPWPELSRDYRRRVRQVVRNADSRIPLREVRVKSTAAVYEFLFDRLDVAACMVRLLELGPYRVRRTEGGKSFRLKNGVGVELLLTDVYSSRGRRVFYARGFYAGSLLPRLDAQAVIDLRFRPVEEALQTGGTLYFQVTDPFYGAVWSVFGPLAEGILHEELAGFVECAQALSEEISRNPRRVYRRMLRSELIGAEDCRAFRAMLTRPETRSRRPRAARGHSDKVVRSGLPVASADGRRADALCGAD